MSRSWLPLVMVAPIIIAIATHNVWLILGNVEAPPPTFGSGSMFDKIASRYDLINRILAVGMDVGWRRKMASVIRDNIITHNIEERSEQKQPPQAQLVPSPKQGTIVLLDLATGTADVALELARTIPLAHIFGIDPSTNMLSIGREKISKSSYKDRIELQYADAQNLVEHFQKNPPLVLRQQNQQHQQQQQQQQQNIFDGATMAFGIRNVPNRSLALCQVLSVLKDGATFCILEFSEPASDAGFLGLIARHFIRHVVPAVGGVVSGSPREYWHLQRSIQEFPSPNHFIDIVTTPSICDAGKFDFHDLHQLNFGSVQLYVFKANKKNKVQSLK